MSNKIKHAKSFLLFGFSILGLGNLWAQTMTTVAGGGVGDGGIATAAIVKPSSIAIATNGSIYVLETDRHRIRVVSAGGTISAFAGDGEPRFGGDGGNALTASFNSPSRIVVGPTGDLFVSDTGNNRIRRVTVHGEVSTYAGSGVAGFSGDGGLASDATLSSPAAMSFDSSGNLYFADTGNHRIRRISPNGQISTVAGNGSAAISFPGEGVAATSTPLASVCAVFAAPNGELYFGDPVFQRVRKIDTNGNITTIAGTGMPIYSGDNGPATMAGLYSPCALARDQSGNLLVAEVFGSRVRSIDSNGVISTLAGQGPANQYGIEDGRSATTTSLSLPVEIAVDGAGNVLVAEQDGYRVRRFAIGGVINTIAGVGSMSQYFGDDGPAISAGLGSIGGVAVDSGGAIYLTDGHRVRKVGTDGMITAFAGTGISGFSGDGGAAIAAQLSAPGSLAIDKFDNLYVVDRGNSRVRRINPMGEIITIAGNGVYGFGGEGGPATSAALYGVQSVAVGLDGSIYIRDINSIKKVGLDGNIQTIGSLSFPGEGELAVDQNGNIFYTNFNLGRVYRISASGQTNSVAGGGGQMIVSGPAGNAQLYSPFGVALDRGGNLYFSQKETIHVIRRVSPFSVIDTVAGKSGAGSIGFSGDGGLATQATMNGPASIAIDARGDVYVADTLNYRVRKITFPLGIQRVFSRRTHGVSGIHENSIDHRQSIDGTLTVESRTACASQTYVFQLNDIVVQSGSATIVDQFGNVAGMASTSAMDRDLLVTMGGTTLAGRMKIRLNGVNGNTSLFETNIGFLGGDVNGSGKTTASDLASIKSRKNSPVTGQNFQFDLDCSGTIDDRDLVIGKQGSGKRL